MPLIMDSPGDINVVRSYGDGAVRVGELRYTRTCVIAPRALLADWPPTSLDDISALDLDSVFALEPEIILLGCRGPSRFTPKALQRVCAARDVGLETMELGAACRTYNVLAAEGRRVVAVLFPV